MCDGANFASFTWQIQGNAISWEKLHCSLMYHEISFSTLTAILPWDFSLCSAVFSFFNHSMGNSLSGPQHYDNIYFGL